jgi:hypothetical protein
MPGKAFNGSDVNHQNPNLIPLKTSQSIASGSRVPTRTPPRAIPAHIEDRRPASASVPLNHPLRLEVERIRESRARRVTVWRECAAKNPQQSQDVNWTLRKSYEKEMKEWCTDEYNILESIERIEEGESYEDVQLHPEILARCLKYDNNVKGRNAFNAPSAYGHPDYGYGTGYLSHPPYNSHYPAFHRGSSETILPSIERDSDEDDCNVEAKEKLTKPPYDPVKTLLRTMPFSHLPHRAALGLPSLPLRTRSEVVLPTRPVVDNNNDEEYLDIDKFPTHVNVIDLTRDSDPMQVAKEDVRRVFTRNDHQPSTPRIKLTAAGLAQKRLRNISSTPFGNNIDPKRRKLISDYKRSGGRHDSWTELQKFRRDPAVMGNALPEETVFSDEESNEDNNEEHNRGYKIGSV